MINFIGGLVAGLILSLMALVLLTEHRNEEDRDKTEHMIKLINERDYWQKQYLFERGKVRKNNGKLISTLYVRIVVVQGHELDKDKLRNELGGN